MHTNNQEKQELEHSCTVKIDFTVFIFGVSETLRMHVYK